MARSKILVFIFLLFSGGLLAQKTDAKLTAQIRELVNSFHGDLGIYIKDLKTGKTVAINADTVFPTASIVKVPILLGVAQQLFTGELNYDSLFTYKDSLLYEGEDILGSFKNGEKIALKKLLMLKKINKK